MARRIRNAFDRFRLGGARGASSAPAVQYVVTEDGSDVTTESGDFVDWG